MRVCVYTMGQAHSHTAAAAPRQEQDTLFIDDYPPALPCGAIEIIGVGTPKHNKVTPGTTHRPGSKRRDKYWKHNEWIPIQILPKLSPVGGEDDLRIYTVTFEFALWKSPDALIVYYTAFVEEWRRLMDELLTDNLFLDLIIVMSKFTSILRTEYDKVFKIQNSSISMKMFTRMIVKLFEPIPDGKLRNLTMNAPIDIGASFYHIHHLPLLNAFNRIFDTPSERNKFHTIYNKLDRGDFTLSLTNLGDGMVPPRNVDKILKLTGKALFRIIQDVSFRNIFLDNIPFNVLTQLEIQALTSVERGFWNHTDIKVKSIIIDNIDDVIDFILDKNTNTVVGNLRNYLLISRYILPNENSFTYAFNPIITMVMTARKARDNTKKLFENHLLQGIEWVNETRDVMAKAEVEMEIVEAHLILAQKETNEETKVEIVVALLKAAAGVRKHIKSALRILTWVHMN